MSPQILWKSQKAILLKFIQLLFWFSLGNTKNNQAENLEWQAGRVDIAVEQCVDAVAG